MGTRSILITCMGTRGDVQPFCALGQHLADRGWHVTVAAPAEFQEFVSNFKGLDFADIGRSIQKEVMETPEGQAMRTAKGLKVFKAARAFFNEGLFGSWFQSVFALCQYLRPSVLVLTSFIQLSGAAAIPEMLDLRTRVVLMHTIPMDLTDEFACPTAGWGLGARRGLGCLNSLSWYAGQKLVVERIYIPIAQRLVNNAASSLSVTPVTLDMRFGCEGRPTVYVYSPSVLPKPADWGPNLHVVGAIFAPTHFTISPDVAARLARKQSLAVGRRVTAKLTGDASTNITTNTLALPGQLSHAPSIPTAAEMAGEGPEDDVESGTERSGSSRDAIAAHPGVLTAANHHGGAAAALVSRRQTISAAAPPPVVERLSLGPSSAATPGDTLPADLKLFLESAKSANIPVVYIGLGSMLATAFDSDRIEEILGMFKVVVCQMAKSKRPYRAILHTTPDAATGGGPRSPFFMLTQPVDHGALLAHCSLAVHHGGAGTMHSVLLAGKPCICIPCIPMTDQRFWAELLIRQRVGPGPLIQVQNLTTARLIKVLSKAFDNLEEYTANAERLAQKIYQEDGAKDAALILEREAELTRL